MGIGFLTYLLHEAVSLAAEGIGKTLTLAMIYLCRFSVEEGRPLKSDIDSRHVGLKGFSQEKV